jgi:hypothetical protein
MHDAQYYELIGRFIYGYQRAAGGLKRMAPLVDANDAAAVAQFKRLTDRFAHLTEWQERLLANIASDEVELDTLVERNAELAEYAHEFARLCEGQSTSS